MLTISQKQERNVADQLSKVYSEVRVQPGSGNTPHAPGDIFISGHAYVECKATNNLSIVLKWSWLSRIRNLASSKGLRAYLALQFGSSSTQWYVVEDYDFLHLLQCEKELNELHRLASKR